MEVAPDGFYIPGNSAFAPPSSTRSATIALRWLFLSQHLAADGDARSKTLKPPRFRIRNFSTRCAPLLNEISLHSRPLLSAAAGEPLAGSDRATGFGLPVPRLERADHCGMLCAERRRADPRSTKAAFSRSSTITAESASTSAPRCWRGRRTRPRACISMILDADMREPRNILGHGSAMAQATTT